MTERVALPQFGDAPAETTIGRWLVRPGDRVDVDDVLCEVQTEKIAAEVHATVAGVVRELLAAEGSVVLSGSPICAIEREADEAVEPHGATGGGAGDVGARDASAAAGAQDGRALLSPVVRRLVRETGIPLEAIPGSGPRGRVTRDDVLRAAAESRNARTERLTPARAATAQRVTRSWRTAPHVFSAIDVDFEAVAVRKKASPERTTWLAYVAAAVVEALRAVPDVNASIDDEARTRTIHDAVHLAISVDVPGRGLFAPVIRHAERLGVTGLAHAIADVAVRARAGALRTGELDGSTFTITNPGIYGSLFTAPIINPPNVAILATDAVEPRVVARGNAIEVRLRANLSMSWDHRAMDGSTAMRFLRQVKETLEAPERAA